jgi:hypothetical protein
LPSGDVRIFSHRVKILLSEIGLSPLQGFGRLSEAPEGNIAPPKDGDRQTLGGVVDSPSAPVL